MYHQAVIIVDSFTLLPIAHGRVLDFILQSLKGIQEIFIFCNDHTLKAQVHSEKVRVFSSTCYFSMGDMMRDLYSRGVIRSDFLLINGSVITNYPLEKFLNQHKSQRQLDKDYTLTMLYRKTDSSREILAVDSNNRLRQVVEKNNQKIIHFPLTLFLQDEINIYNNILNTFIYICSPCVPTLFYDNVHYETMQDFVNGLLTDEDILRLSMHVRICETGYGSHISNWEMYNSITRHIMGRWVYPIVPDASGYSYSRHNVYTKVKFDSKMAENVIVDGNSCIDENTVITNSVVGQSCTIGKNVVIRQSYLSNNVVVEDDCELIQCFVMNNVTLKKGSILENKWIDIDSCTIWQEDCESDKIKGSCTIWEEDCESDKVTGNGQHNCESDIHEEVFKTLQRENVDIENLILEINCLRYAYNITINEMNRMIVLSILKLGKDLPSFINIIKHYIKTIESQNDCLDAIAECCEPSVVKILYFWYCQDVLLEPVIIKWFYNLKEEKCKKIVQPFIEWLETAEEEE